MFDAPSVFRTFNITATSADTAGTAISGTITTVRICGTVDCYVNQGAAANAASLFMPAGVPEYLTVAPGTVLHVLRAGSTDGVLNVTELTR